MLQYVPKNSSRSPCLVELIGRERSNKDSLLIFGALSLSHKIR